MCSPKAPSQSTDPNRPKGFLGALLYAASNGQVTRPGGYGPGSSAAPAAVIGASPSYQTRKVAG